MRPCRRAAVFVLCVTAPLGAQSAQSDSIDSATLTPGLIQPGLWEQVGRHVAKDSMTNDSTPAPSEKEVFGRVAAGTLGATLGGIGGAVIGFTLFPHGRCRCDDPGANELLTGAAVGVVSGAALAAAIPTQDSHCSYGRRVLHGFLGAVAGGALGLLAPKGNARVLVVPLGTGLGAGILSAFC